MAELPSKTQSFMDWYLEVLEVAQLTDKRYPVKGMNVWTPYGFLARRQLDGIMIREIEATGSRPVEFPTLIPATEFQKEKEHIKGFDAEVFWVTRGGASELDIPLVLRPTSETAMYPVFKLWIRSHRDMPLNVYQIVNTFRYETKTTRPFLRVREIHFFEEHTCQVDEAAATARVTSNLAAFQRMADALVIPYLAVRRPEWDKFPGAFYTIAFDLPLHGAQTLQLGSVHHYRENFSRPYEITYEAPDGTQRHAHQTTFGLSERLLGALVAVHGDQKGIVFPASVAPYQIVIIPIPSTGTTGADPRPFAREVAEQLTARGIRVHLDDREERPGAKYYHWESMGVPLRLEIGRREAEGRQVTAVDRLGTKGTTPFEGIGEALIERLRAFDRTLAERARAAFRASFAFAQSLPELQGSPTVRLIGWCGREECGHEVEKAIDGALLGTLESELPIPAGAPPVCVACGTTQGCQWAAAGQPI